MGKKRRNAQQVQTPNDSPISNDDNLPAAESSIVEAEEKSLVTLDVFVRICGLKLDQTRGFARWARDEGLRSLCVEDWRLAWGRYLARSV